MYVDNYSTQFDEEKEQFVFLFELQDKNGNATSGNGKVIIKIVNDDGTTVYNATKFFAASNFGTWSDSYGEYYLGAIYIDAKDILKASKSGGTFYFKLYVGNLEWEELSCEISNLPYNQSVQYIGEERIQYDETKNNFTLLFQFTDSSNVPMSASGTIAIRIVDNKGVVVYNKTKSFTEKDFSIWTNNNNDEFYLCAIVVNANEVLSTTSSGKIYYTITLSDGVFNDRSLTINNLPLKKTVLNTASLPITANKIDYYNEVESSVQVTDVTFENDNSDGTSINIYISGKKTYDKYGNSHDAMCWLNGNYMIRRVI